MWGQRLSLCFYTPNAYPYPASLMAQMVKNLPAVWETWVPSLGREDPMEKGMGTHPSMLVWRIPWTEEPGGVQSLGSNRVRYDWVTNTNTYPVPIASVSQSVQSLSRVRVFATPWIAVRQASLSITNSRSLLQLMPSSRWYHPAISSSVVPFSSCPHSLPASGSFPMSQLFTSGGQSTGVSASASVHPVNTQDWSPLEWTGWMSLQSKGLSRVFSNIIVQKHQFFSAQLSSQSTFTSIHDHWKNHRLDQMDLCWQSNVSAFQYAI